MNVISKAKRGTILAPSNEAFDEIPKEELDAVLNDPERAKALLGLHFLDQRVSSVDARVVDPQNEAGMFSAQPPFPASSEERVWFFVDNTTLMVDAKGSGAIVEEADIAVTNGVIHIMDRVLGFPYQTIEQKLDVDPMMS